MLDCVRMLQGRGRCLRVHRPELILQHVHLHAHRSQMTSITYRFAHASTS